MLLPFCLSSACLDIIILDIIILDIKNITHRKEDCQDT